LQILRKGELNWLCFRCPFSALARTSLASIRKTMRWKKKKKLERWGFSSARKSAQLLPHHTTVVPGFFFPLDFGSGSLAGLWHDKDAQILSRLAG
jgi:hypothetical protein